MFVNFSNHASADWPQRQRRAAEEIGGVIVDRPFPEVPAEAGAGEVEELARVIAGEICETKPISAMVQGEYTLTWCLVRRLHALGVPCYSATSKRVVRMQTMPDGSLEKTSRFEFVRFRRYP